MISWTDTRGLQTVEARYGARAASYIPAHGPIVLAHMIGIGEPFRSINIVRLLQQNEWPTFTEARCHDIVMQVIKYINNSDMPYYVQQQRVRKTYMWFLFNPGGNKSQLREADAMHAAKSRHIVNRPYNAHGAVEIRTRHGIMPIESIAAQSLTPAQINHVRAGVLAFLQKINCPTSHIQSADAALKMYDAAVIDKFITDTDDINMLPVDVLKSALREIFGLSNNS